MGVLADSIGISSNITIEEEDASPSVSTATIKVPDRCLAVDHSDATVAHIRAAPH